MLYPLSRGNHIQWQLNNNIINIFDHSYNNSFESLIMMVHQLMDQEGTNILIFTPIRECKHPEEKYKILIDLINDHKIMSFIYDPKNEFQQTSPYLRKFADKTQLSESIINLMDQDINIFIKGANSLKMMDVVLNLLEYLGNN